MAANCPGSQLPKSPIIEGALSPLNPHRQSAYFVKFLPLESQARNWSTLLGQKQLTKMDAILKKTPEDEEATLCQTQGEAFIKSILI